MKELYLFGAGKVGRNIIETLPYGSIKGVMDSDNNKVGTIYESFVVEPIDYQLIKNKGYEVIFSFYDYVMINECNLNNINWYVSWGGVNNIYDTEEVSWLVIENLLNRFNSDKRLLADAEQIIHVKQFRDVCYSEFNKDLIQLMKIGNMQAVSDKLNAYYNEIENDKGILEDEYFEHRVGFHLADKIIFEKINEENRNTFRLLDVACGHGDFISRLNQKGFKAEGIDISESRVRFLTEKGIKAYVGTAENTGLESESYDFVTCFECLEHVVNPILVINEIGRILKSEGFLLISVPYKRRCDCDTHVRIFDENSMISLLGKHFDVSNVILIPYLFGNPYNNMFLMAKKKG